MNANGCFAVYDYNTCIYAENIRISKQYFTTYRNVASQQPASVLNCMQKCKYFFRENIEKLHVRKINRQEPAGSKQGK